MLEDAPGEGVPEPPEIWAENALSYRAFWDLHPERPQYFGGVGYIPLATMLGYAEWKGLEVEALFSDLRAMDAAYLKHQAEKHKAEQEERKREAEREARRKHGPRR